jgi:glycosyltransferase involved in cell wall biosynthesis
VASETRQYWADQHDYYATRYTNRYSLRHLIEKDLVEPFLLDGDVYCCASLGEGCSNSSLYALALGIPMVTSNCGALPEIAGEAEHLLFSRPGDLDDFTERLRMMLERFQEKEIEVDRDKVLSWRDQFSPERERDQWKYVVERLFINRALLN